MDNEHQAVIKAKRLSKRDNEPYYILTDGESFFAASEVTILLVEHFRRVGNIKQLTGRVIHDYDYDDEEFDG